MTTLPVFRLPINPESYYGHSISIENLAPGFSIYVGPSSTAKEVLVQNISYNPEGWYEVFTEHAVYFAKPSTRVGFKNS